MPRFHIPFNRRTRYRKRSHLRLALLLLFSTVLCVLIVPVYFIYKPPSFLIRYAQNRWPDVLWHVPTSKKIVALTIDDAPSQHTQQLIQILKDNHATATFFVIGSQVEGREQTLQDLIRNGHELANHAMYDEPSRSLSNDELTQQINTVQGQVARAYAAVGLRQQPTKYFRPGSGFFNERMRKLLKELGYKLVLGSVYPHDPQIPYWRINARHILSMVQPGAIIICHDRRSWTPPMLERVLSELHAQGWQVVTVSRLLKGA